MRIVFAGTPEPAVPSLTRLLESSRHEVIAVITRPDTVAGRGRKPVRSAIAQVADEAGIEVLTPARPSEPAFLERLAALAPEAAPVVAYGALLPPAALAIPTHGWLNLHFSLLPHWRGAAPVQAAIAAGDTETGASVFELEEGLDSGPVYGVVTESIHATDTAGDLLARLAVSGAGLLEAVLDGIEDGALRAVPQQTDDVSYAPKITVDEARVDWSTPAFAVDRRVRAMTPNPGAWTTVDNGDAQWRIKLGPVRVDPEAAHLPPGALLVEKRRVLVGTATEPVVLGDVQPQGKQQMAAADWARGARLGEGALAR